jgi:hypothetical protein
MCTSDNPMVLNFAATQSALSTSDEVPMIRPRISGAPDRGAA